MSIKYYFLLLLIIPVALAQGADWVQFDLKHDWNRLSVGFCNYDSQCLVSNSFNETFDNLSTSYWDGLVNPALGPKCIDDAQFILDHYCMNGVWTSRTRLVAEQLLAFALANEPENFALYCDHYDKALNRFGYSTEFGKVIDYLDKNCAQESFSYASTNRDCVNNVCVLKYGQNVVFGTALNTQISGAQTFLHALDLLSTACNSAINSDGDYDPCGTRVWYNGNTNSLIYAPGVARMDPPVQLVYDFFNRPFEKLNDYVFENVHNPKSPPDDYFFFNATPDFNYLYISKDGFEFAYSFKQENITMPQIDYAGWYFSNIELPSDACSRLVKTFHLASSGDVSCEVQEVPTEFYIVARATPAVAGKEKTLVNNWNELTGKLRVIS